MTTAIDAFPRSASGQSGPGHNAAVSVEKVAKRFGSVVALEETDLSVEQGTFMTLLGPSGCGKSTLLNLISGFAEPSAGEIYLAGKRITHDPAYRRNVGMVFQNYALFPHMTVAENVGYGLRMRRVARPEIEQRVTRALDMVKLTGFSARRPRELSGGQQQRVAIARAIVIDPLVLLLDEPLSALDKNLRASMQIELKDIQTRVGITTIFVTHDQGEALSLSDQIGVMSNGRICQIGTPEEIYKHPRDAFVASFIGDINRMIGHPEGTDGGIARLRLDDGAELRVLLDNLTAGAGRDVAYDVFVRPERFQLTAPDAPNTITGTVERHVYQGGHVDLYVTAPAAAGGSLHLRLHDLDAMTRWPVGAPVGVEVAPENVLLFPRAG